jgi:hypothetical protein
MKPRRSPLNVIVVFDGETITGPHSRMAASTARYNSTESAGASRR